MDLLTKLFRLPKVIRGKDKYFKIQTNCPKLNLGNKAACFTVNPIGLNNESVIYSFGCGTDISFDTQLINQFGCSVFAFDPTPKSIEWLNNQEVSEKFIFTPLGLSNFDGTTKFYLPVNENHVSSSIIQTKVTSGNFVTVEMKRLISLLKTNNHSKIDILKMDIEGAEYEVIDDILNSKIEIKQILIEFHHRFNEFGLKSTEQAIKKLNAAGYLIFDVSATGEEFSFIK